MLVSIGNGQEYLVGQLYLAFDTFTQIDGTRGTEKPGSLDPDEIKE